MTKFHTLKIGQVKRETADCVSVYFDIPEALKKEYTYKPGQYLTLKLFINGEECRRAYSLCTSPYVDSVPGIAVKKVEGGKVSNFINDNMKVGDSLEVMTPMGNFTPELNEFYSRQFVLFAGGSGITPVLSILKSILEAEPSSSVTLFYGNRDKDSIVFYREIDEIEGHFADRCKVIHVIDKPSHDWSGETGILNSVKVKELLKKHVDTDLAKCQYFICGPGAMMGEVKRSLESESVPADKIHIEYFTSNLQEKDGHPADTAVGEVDDTPFTGKAEVHIDLHGDEHVITVKEKDTILSSAMHAGIDPPFACQMGICTTCRAIMLEGKVHMNETEGLTTEEIEQGYILTCQSHPRSNKIVVRYE